MSTAGLLALMTLVISALFFTTPSFAKQNRGDRSETTTRVKRGGRGNSAKALLRSYVDQDDMKAARAGAFGMTVEEMDTAKENAKTAVEAVKTDAIDAAVADGTITQEEADQIKSGEGRPSRKAMRAIRSTISKDDMKAAYAGAFGMTVEELEAAKEDAKEAQKAVVMDAIDAAVADGALTEAQAESLKARGEAARSEGVQRRGRTNRGQRQAPSVVAEA